MGFAVVGGKPVVILPGPIQGALNAFIVLGYPLVRYHLGMGWEQPRPSRRRWGRTGTRLGSSRGSTRWSTFG